MIRTEVEKDFEAVFALHASVFPSDAEARLVEVLRQQVKPLVSLVVERESQIDGHILFSPVQLDGPVEGLVLGLAPMAVQKERQLKGVGSKLVKVGIEYCRELGASGVVVLGHPKYYPRFGFKPGSQFGLRCEYDVPDEAFMAFELTPGAFATGTSSLVRYHDAFKSL